MTNKIEPLISAARLLSPDPLAVWNRIDDELNLHFYFREKPAISFGYAIDVIDRWRAL